MAKFFLSSTMKGRYHGIDLNINQMYLILSDGDILYSCPPVLDPKLSIETKYKLINFAKTS